MAGTAETLVREEAAPRRRSFLADVSARLFREKPLGAIGGVIVVLLFLTGILAPLIAPYGYNQYHERSFLEAPSREFWLGTDNVGRDLLSRIIWGARISMVVGLAGAGIAVVTATLIGGVSGFFGGRVDLALQRFVDTWMCFPGLVIILTVMAVVGPGMVQVIMVLGISGGIGGSRVVRSAVISIKENVFVEAARAIGARPSRILVRHILPNVMAPIIILFTTGVGGMVLAEASISFLGYGIPPPLPSWGGMLSGSARYQMTIAPWLVIWPGLALTLVVYGVNMFGDALRDLLDPRLRGGLGRYGGVKRKKRQ